MSEHQNGTTSIGDFPIHKTGLPTDKNLRNRLESLKDQFKLRFRQEPSVYLRVPGRVNLIGEHIDYCGYSVCPMALQQDILVALGTAQIQPFLTILNQECEKYKEYTSETHNFKISLESTGWASYLLCGVRSIVEQLAADKRTPSSLQMAISGNIPPGSGLSSSSALVCAGILATAIANNVRMTRLELASHSAEAEHYIGTAGGGMDQAIIFLASHGCAKRIDFNPLKTTDVTLPAGAVFVVSHSLVTKNKAACSDFNTRVVECRIAAQILSKHKNLNWEKCLRLADFQAEAGLTLAEAIKMVQQDLHQAPYTKQEVCQLLEVTEEQLNSLTLTHNTQHVNEFKLYQRAMHVFQEAERVSQFEEGCRSGCALDQLGRLMSASHTSLRDLYQCSHPELDRLVGVATAAGALGARLTGAGWGGCIVALTTEDHVDQFIKTVKQQFYADNPLAASHKIDDLIFATQPGQGAQIFSPESNA